METKQLAPDPTSSTREPESVAQRSAKRLKTDIWRSFNEAEGAKTSRVSTFSHSPFSKVFRLRLIEAGFFYCDKNDRVMCIYCNLICHQWNVDIDDPCKVHKVLSPACSFVKSMTCYHSSEYKNIMSTLPRHKGYVYLEDRLRSFSSWSGRGFPSKHKLAYAGFFCDGSKIVCFYCNHTFHSWESDNHPIAEHVRYSRHCNYARQLCGKVLYNRIQDSLKVKNGIVNSKNIQRTLSTIDADKLDNLVNAGLDLPMSEIVLRSYPRPIVKQCWIDRLQFPDGDFENSTDLSMACRVLQLQNKSLANGTDKIVVPGIALSGIYGSSHQPALNNSNETYDDVLVSIEDDCQAYKKDRERLSLEFKEDEVITIRREESMVNRTNIEPSPHAMAEGGWILHVNGDCIWQCPHCFMQYSQWKSDDKPLMIHRELSPLCLFALSSNPFHENPATLINPGEQYPDEVINAAESQAYAGVVRAKHETNSEICKRQQSFDLFPHNDGIDTNELAINGFWYNHHRRCIQCYYCDRTIFFVNGSPRFDRFYQQLHLWSGCRYAQQLNDRDQVNPIQQTAGSGKCSWCLTGDKNIFHPSCRKLCLCESCSKKKRLCPRCNGQVTAYVKMYPS